MRPGKFTYIFGLLALVALFGLMAGCSDDKQPTASNTDNTQYQAVTAEVNSLLDSSVTEFAANLVMIEEGRSTGQTDNVIDTRYSSFNPDSVVLSSDDWHVVYANDLVAGYYMELVDSLQFTKHGFVQPTVRDCDALSLIHRYTYMNPDTTGDYRNSEIVTKLLFSNLSSTQAVINGTKEHTIVVKSADTDVKRTYDINMTLNGITIDKVGDTWASGCPTTGSVTGTVTYTQQNSSTVPTTTTWNYEITFTNGEVAATVTAGAYSRTYTATVCQ